jgi:dihydrofolate reductase
MRKLVASAFVSLDGVMQAPGAPEEDPTGGFAYGGWIFNYGDEGMDISASGFDGKDRDVVLGRKTYEIFEAYWPYQPADNPIAKTLNSARKYVASRTLKTLQWKNSVLLGEDIAQAIAALKAQPGYDLQIIGSSNLIQSLQAASLIDEYNVWTYPLILGRGKRLFESTAKPSALRLVSTKASTTGVVMSTYVPAGNIRPGSFAQAKPSQKELDRRAKMAREDGEGASAH